MRTAFILPPTAASFRPVAGLPLVQRTVLAALRCDCERVVVFGGPYAARVRALLARDARTRPPLVEVADDPCARLAESLTAPDAEIAVIAADFLLTPAALRRACTPALDGRPALFTAAGRPALARCRPKTLAAADLAALAAGCEADALWARLRTEGAAIIPLAEEPCLQITDAPSAAAAEAALCAHLRAESADTDGPLARWIDRRVSIRLSRWLVRHTSLAPNHITLIGTGVGLAGAWVLARGTYAAGVVGTALFLAATIIDGCDGEVARLTFRESTFGQWLDVGTDNLVHVAIFVGLAVGLHRQHPGGHHLWLMALLLGGFALDGLVSYYFLVVRTGWRTPAHAPGSFKARARQRLLEAFEAVMNRDFAYLLVLLALAGRLRWFFWGALVGTYLFAILFVWIYRWSEPT